MAIPPGPNTPYGLNVPAAAPSKKTVDLRSLSYGLSGPEPPYPVYQFSGYRTRWEWPGHEPFTNPGYPLDNLGPQPIR